MTTLEYSTVGKLTGKQGKQYKLQPQFYSMHLLNNFLLFFKIQMISPAWLLFYSQCIMWGPNICPIQCTHFTFCLVCLQLFYFCIIYTIFLYVLSKVKLAVSETVGLRPQNPNRKIVFLCTFFSYLDFNLNGCVYLWIITTWEVLEAWGFLHHKVHQMWRSVHDT